MKYKKVNNNVKVQMTKHYYKRFKERYENIQKYEIFLKTKKILEEVIINQENSTKFELINEEEDTVLTLKRNGKNEANLVTIYSYTGSLQEMKNRVGNKKIVKNRFELIEPSEFFNRVEIIKQEKLIMKDFVYSKILIEELEKMVKKIEESKRYLNTLKIGKNQNDLS